MNRGTKETQANKEIPVRGKDNVSRKPLDTAKNTLSLSSLFLFNTNFSRPVKNFI